ncbi:MAG TPA: hypothetical protein VF476_03620 [Chitinophagaceae bacterium]
MTFLKIIPLFVIQFFSLNCIAQSYQQSEINKGIHSKKGFEKYKGNIEVLGDSVIKYDNAILRLGIQIRPYRIIFEKGIFYPSVLDGDSSGGSWEKAHSDSLKIGVLNFHKRTIGVFEEITPTSTPFTTKRFRLWVFTEGLHNPSEYIMDLTNYSATESTGLKAFFSTATITYIRFVTLII